MLYNKEKKHLSIDLREASYDAKMLLEHKNIEELSIHVKDVFNDIQLIASTLPNLKRMSISAKHAIFTQLPPEIGFFKHLEYLCLRYFEATDLPSELKKLRNLKVLDILVLKNKVLTSKTFPQVLCEMNGLEELILSQNIVSLPDKFSNLSGLKLLDFSFAFNPGKAFHIEKWGEQYLHPIPEVIGKLPSLQNLSLNACGVVNVAFLKPLKTLKVLNIMNSGLADCNEWSHFKKLESLNLANTQTLTNIEGLAGLPIKMLDLQNCRNLECIDAIKDLSELEELNIDLCHSIKNLDAIYQHPNLKVLEAPETLMKLWRSKEQLKNMPPLDKVIDDLSAKELTVVEASIHHLGLYVEKNGYLKNNPLAEYFGEKANNYKVVNLPLLDAAFIKHQEKLSTDTLVNLVKMSLRTINEDNYNITLLSIKEIILRKDERAQQQVIAQFEKACENYFGPRYWKRTVYDQLFDDLFPAFESVALSDLLEDASMRVMDFESGGGGYRLFAPAFKRCRTDTDFEVLLHIFFKYEYLNLEHYGLQYFTDLHNEILAVLTNKYHIKFLDELDKRGVKTELYSLLESNDINDLIKLIKVLGQKENEKFLALYSSGVLEKVHQLELPLDHVTKALDFIIYKRKIDCSIVHSVRDASDVYDVYDVYDSAVYATDSVVVRSAQYTIIKYIHPEGKGAIIEHLKTKENVDNKTYLAAIVIGIINDFNEQNALMEDIQPFREYLKKLCHCDDDTVYLGEMHHLCFALRAAHFYDDIFYNNLDRFEKIASLLTPPLISVPTKGALNGNGPSALWSLAKNANKEQWNIIKRMCRALFRATPLDPPLFMAVRSAANTKDNNFLDFLKPYIPETIEMEDDAYSLAQSFSLFSEKKLMLKYVRRSMELGQTKTKFLNDPHFFQYIQDHAFLNALEM